MTDTLDVVAELARSASRIGRGRRCWPTTLSGSSSRSPWPAEDLDGRSVCVIVPDGTRSCPLPLLLSAGATRHCTGRRRTLTVLIALGTHAAMSDDHLAKHLGYADARPRGRPTRA